MFGLDLLTLAVAFFLFAIVLVILWNIIWHTFHGDIGAVFILVIITFILLGIITLVLDFTLF